MSLSAFHLYILIVNPSIQRQAEEFWQVLGGRPQDVADAQSGGDDAQAEVLWPALVRTQVLQPQPQQAAASNQGEESGGLFLFLGYPN